MEEGLTFTRGGNTRWRAGAMQTALEGLMRVEHFFRNNRSRIKNALGLNGGTLDLILNQATGSSYMEAAPEEHTILLNREHPEAFTERGVQTFVHELGHIVDYQAVRVTGIGADGRWSRAKRGPWTNASGWYWNNCVWLLSEWGAQGAVSAYAFGGMQAALHDPTASGPLPEEDFAETFNWVVQEANDKAFWPSGADSPDDKRQINPNNTSNTKTDPNPERRRAIEDLLRRF